MDLLHRLRVLAFEIPRLRDRQDDLMPLARHFCAEIGRQYRRGPCDLAPDVEPVLRGYAWPGNVRELRNVLERAILLAQGSRLEAAHLEGLLAAPASGRTVEGRFVLPEAGLELEALERELLRQALERTEGNRTRAAALLGMSRDTLRYRIEKFGLD
jgi:DNA-binding NtrC family response regulator